MGHTLVLSNERMSVEEGVEKSVPSIPLPFYQNCLLNLWSDLNVAKSWYLLFKNDHFMNMFRNIFLSNGRSYCHNSSLLLQISASNTYVSELYSLSWERFKNRVGLYFPNPFQEEALCHFDIFNSGSINDFICVLSSSW